MITCPICGAATEVCETRSVENYVKRRRRCKRIACTGRLTTIEGAVTRTPDPRVDGALAIVPRAHLERLYLEIGAFLQHDRVGVSRAEVDDDDASR